MAGSPLGDSTMQFSPTLGGRCTDTPPAAGTK
uniref:Uncharacterized protein n=1 Tax=Myoviridae sp. ctiv53 TaxID=2827703 RepID=A0A8S5THU3_9CAUD|nr:MAG TPA: hypothetical protein [Myoviridae sp. ctiv53]